VFFAQGSGGDIVRARLDVPRGEYMLLPVATFIWTFFDPCASRSVWRRAGRSSGTVTGKQHGPRNGLGGYSSRNAIVGSIRVARRVGK
jgi:hypothetical protein